MSGAAARTGKLKEKQKGMLANIYGRQMWKITILPNMAGVNRRIIYIGKYKGLEVEWGKTPYILKSDKIIKSIRPGFK